MITKACCLRYKDGHLTRTVCCFYSVTGHCTESKRLCPQKVTVCIHLMLSTPSACRGWQSSVLILRSLRAFSPAEGVDLPGGCMATMASLQTSVFPPSAGNQYMYVVRTESHIQLVWKQCTELLLIVSQKSVPSGLSDNLYVPSCMPAKKQLLSIVTMTSSTCCPSPTMQWKSGSSCACLQGRAAADLQSEPEAPQQLSSELCNPAHPPGRPRGGGCQCWLQPGVLF